MSPNPKKRPVSTESSGSEDEEMCGFSFDFGGESAAPKDVPPMKAASVDGLTVAIQSARERQKERIEALPESAVLVGSEDEQEEDNDDEDDDEDDDDGVEVTVDSDLEQDEGDKTGEGVEEKSTEFEMESFAELNLSKPIMKALSVVGFTRPTPIQAAAIPAAMAGKDVCGGAVTGSGKTAAFLIPILERLLHRSRSGPASIRVLILLPTRELAVQCHKVALDLAKFTDVKAALIAGGLPMRQQEVELRARPEILVATPGRLIDHLTNSQSFTLESIEILVLDEADRMLEQGFADELDEIIKHTPKQRQTMMFSATLTDTVEDLMRLSLDKPVRLHVDQSDTIARKLVQEFVRIRDGREEDRLPIVLALCKRTLKERCILFFPTKDLAHRARILLGLLGLDAAELHGGLSQVDRLNALERFKTGKVELLVATDVAARGLDIPGVQHVLNYNMPLNYKQYVHRIGRTARAGASGRSITLVGEGTDRKVLRAALKHSTAPLQHRIIAKETIQEYRRLMDDLEPEVQHILEMERQEKALGLAERDLGRAENIMKHREQIKARPAKAWFQSEKQKRASKNKEQRKN